MPVIWVATTTVEESAMTTEQVDFVFDLEGGRADRDVGVTAIETSHLDFVPRMRAAARAWSMQYGRVTADDVRRLAWALKLEPRHKNAWGAIFRGPGWKKIGEEASRVRSNHAHVNPVWMWVEPLEDPNEEP